MPYDQHRCILARKSEIINDSGSHHSARATLIFKLPGMQMNNWDLKLDYTIGQSKFYGNRALLKYTESG